MKKISKIVCVVLSIMLTVNMLALDTVASGVSAEGQKAAIGTEDNQSTGDGVDNGSKIENSDEKNKEDDLTGADDSSQVGSESQNITDANTGDAVEADGVSDEDQTVASEFDENKTYVTEFDAATVGKDSAKITWKSEGNDSFITGYDIKLYSDDEHLEEFDKTVIRDPEEEDDVQLMEAEEPEDSDEPKEFSQDISGLETGVAYRVQLTAYTTEENTNEKIAAKAAEDVIIILTAPVLTGKASEATAALTWTAVKGATSYTVYEISESERKEIATVSNQLSYNYKVPKNNVTYMFEVDANADGAVSVASNRVSLKPRTIKPGKVSNFSIMDGELSAVLTWSKASNANSYWVYRYNTSKKRWDVVGKPTGTSYTNTKLSANKTYQYRVAAVRTIAGETVVGDMTSTKSIKIKSSPGSSVRQPSYRVTIKSKAPAFATSTSTKRVTYLKRGTRGTTLAIHNGRYQIKLSNGKKYWVARGRLNYNGTVWTTKDYSTKTKLNFVNSKKYSSPTKYLIWINQYTQRVMIYTGKKGNWKLVRTARCAAGRGTGKYRTPYGVYRITRKEKGWFYRYTYEKPVVRFYKKCAFHSRIKKYKGGYGDGPVGRPRSNGCIRLNDSDINYIYNKCPKNTTVVSH